MTPRSIVKLMCLVDLAAISAAADNDAPVHHQVLRGSGRLLKKNDPDHVGYGNSLAPNWCQDISPDFDESPPGGSCTMAGTVCVWKSTPCKGDCFEDKCDCDGTELSCFVNRRLGCEWSPNGNGNGGNCPVPPTPAPEDV